MIGVFGSTDDVSRPFSFSRVSLVLQFLSIADATGAANWTLTNSSHIGVEFQYSYKLVGDSVSPSAHDVRGFLTLLDLAPPVFTVCPGDVAVDVPVDGATANATWATPVALDNREVSALTATAHSGSSFPLLPPGTAPARVVYEARDLFDNAATCEFDVVVVDTAPPLVPAPLTVVKVLPANSAVVAVAASEWTPSGVSDNAQALGGAALVWAAPSLVWHNATATYTYGTHVVGMRFSDAFGNIASTHTTVDVRDTTPPNSACPSDIERLAPVGASQTAVAWVLQPATDNSNLPVTVTVNRTSGDAFAVGTHAVGVTATDVAGNAATCAFTITVTGQSPTISGNTTQSPQTPSSGSSSSDMGIIAGGGGAGGLLLVVIIVAAVLLVRARRASKAPQNWDEIFELMKAMETSDGGFRCACVCAVACVVRAGREGGSEEKEEAEAGGQTSACESDTHTHTHTLFFSACLLLPICLCFRIRRPRELRRSALKILNELGKGFFGVVYKVRGNRECVSVCECECV